MVICVLLGPFTPLQKRFVKNSMMIRPDMVLCALRWLKANNVLYHDIQLPAEGDLPTALIVDRTQHADSQDTNIESRLEYTVAFPNTDDITVSNGGCTSTDEFRRQVMDTMDTTTATTLVSRCTPNRLIDYRGDALLRAFPLQFPYGLGLPPKEKSCAKM
jgi:hypothetical protein